MSHDQDTIDEYRGAGYQPEHISDDEAARRYEADSEFVTDAIDALAATDDDDIPDAVKTALFAWYRTTDTYQDSVRHVRDEAERP